MEGVAYLIDIVKISRGLKFVQGVRWIAWEPIGLTALTRARCLDVFISSAGDICVLFVESCAWNRLFPSLTDLRVQ
jgi:hypothetical protein